MQPASIPLPPNPIGKFAPLPFGPIKIQTVEKLPCIPVEVASRPRPALHEKLAPDSPIITAEIYRILCLMHKYPYDDQWHRIPKYFITSFVEAIEEGHQYFDLFNFLREEYQLKHYLSSQDTFLNVLVDEIKNMDKFNKLEDVVIRHAVNERISEFKAQHKVQLQFDFMTSLATSDSNSINVQNDFFFYKTRFQSMYPDLDSATLELAYQWYRIQRTLDNFTGEVEVSYVQRIENMREQYLQRCLKRQEEDTFVYQRPVYKLVLNARIKGYVMDQDPEVELRKDVLYDGWFQFHFWKDAPMEYLLYQARTVAVSNVPLTVSEQDIKHLFFCGEIEHVKMELESGHNSQIAFVVFKDFRGMENALIMQGPAVLELPVTIKPCLDSQLRQALSDYLLSETASFINSYKEKAQFDKALEKYRLLRGSYIESNNKLSEVPEPEVNR